MVMAAVDLLEKNPNPNDEEIRTGLAGNLCRCTGYMKIFESVVRALGPNVDTLPTKLKKFDKRLSIATR